MNIDMLARYGNVLHIGKKSDKLKIGNFEVNKKCAWGAQKASHLYLAIYQTEGSCVTFLAEVQFVWELDYKPFNSWVSS